MGQRWRLVTGACVRAGSPAVWPPMTLTAAEAYELATKMRALGVSRFSLGELRVEFIPSMTGPQLPEEADAREIALAEEDAKRKALGDGLEFWSASA